jgi:hypothetical protein
VTRVFSPLAKRKDTGYEVVLLCVCQFFDDIYIQEIDHYSYFLRISPRRRHPSKRVKIQSSYFNMHAKNIHRIRVVFQSYTICLAVARRHFPCITLPQHITTWFLATNSSDSNLVLFRARSFPPYQIWLTGTSILTIENFALCGQRVFRFLLCCRQSLLSPEGLLAV